MTHKIVRLKPKAKLIFVGDIHEHDQQFFELLSIIKPDTENILVSVGDVYHKGFGLEVANKIISKMMEMQSEGSLYFVRGNHEIKEWKIRKEKDKYLQWTMSQPNAITFEFDNNLRVLVLHAGVTPHHTHLDLSDNIEVMYVRSVDVSGDYIPLEYKEGSKRPVRQGKTWHEVYDGRFGYIVSGHDSQPDGKVKFYKHSVNLDTRCYETGLLSALEITESGIGKLHQISGPAFKE